MWPDIVERNEETSFIVDFHQAGFKKLRDHWDEVRKEIAEANGPDLVTFQAYEMHSSLSLIHIFLDFCKLQGKGILLADFSRTGELCNKFETHNDNLHKVSIKS